MVKEDIDDKRLSIILKICVYLSGIALIAIGISTFITFAFSEPADFFLSLYYILFGALCILMELPWERTLEFFAFLKYYIGKALFLLFCGTLIFKVDPWWNMITGVLFFITGTLYLVLAFSCKDKIVDRSADEKHEDKPFEPAGDQPREKEGKDDSVDINEPDEIHQAGP